MVVYYVQEMYYCIGDKFYFVFVFKNDVGGYEFCNLCFKGSILFKDIIYIWQLGKKNDSCFVFEGVMDYFFFIVIWQKINFIYFCFDWQDYVILNLIINVDKVLYLLVEYEYIYCFLDNDDVGCKVI